MPSPRINEQAKSACFQIFLPAAHGSGVQVSNDELPSDLSIGSACKVRLKVT